MNNITDLNEHRRLREHAEVIPVPSDLHVTIELVPLPDHVLEKTGLLVGEKQTSSNPLAEDWTGTTGLPNSCLGITGALTPDMQRHTVDIDRQPMSVEDEPRETSVVWQRVGMLVMFVLGMAMGYAFMHWVLPHWLGGWP
jgi:hypothetical protein